MPRGIIIFGSAGSGKTSLGKMVADKINVPYYDIDNFIWRKDTPKAYTVMYSSEEKKSRLMAAISKADYFVMAGSMGSFNEPFVPLFDLAVHLTASVETRLERLKKREYEMFGDRILENGDMYEENQRFLLSAANYDFDASPSYKEHTLFADKMLCKVLKLSGEDSLEENAKIIVNEYKKIRNGGVV